MNETIISNSRQKLSLEKKDILNFEEAVMRLKNVVIRTPLTFNQNLSAKYQCNIFLKREDLQVVRSYKIRGAYNMMSNLPTATDTRGDRLL